MYSIYLALMLFTTYYYTSYFDQIITVKNLWFEENCCCLFEKNENIKSTYGCYAIFINDSTVREIR